MGSARVYPSSFAQRKNTHSSLTRLLIGEALTGWPFQVCSRSITTYCSRVRSVIRGVSVLGGMPPCHVSRMLEIWSHYSIVGGERPFHPISYPEVVAGINQRRWR